MKQLLLSVLFILSLSFTSCEDPIDNSTEIEDKVYHRGGEPIGISPNPYTPVQPVSLTLVNNTISNPSSYSTDCSTGTIGIGTGHAIIKIGGISYRLDWRPLVSGVGVYPNGQSYLIMNTQLSNEVYKFNYLYKMTVVPNGTSC